MKNYIPWIISVILAVLLFASLQECSRRGNNQDDNLNALTDSIKYYKNRLGTETASKATLQLSNSQMKEYILKKDKELAELSKEFANVKTVIKTKTELKIDTILIPYDVPVPCDFKRTGEVKDKWYRFMYTSNQNGLKIDSLTIPTKITAITGTKRKWFLGKETLTTDITSDNPYLKVNDITSAEVTIPTPWYKKWYVWAAVGAAGGFLIAK